jgi:hypothetical protein
MAQQIENLRYVDRHLPPHRVSTTACHRSECLLKSFVVMGKPENRYYRAIYVVGDDEVGQTSDSTTLVCLL